MSVARAVARAVARVSPRAVARPFPCARSILPAVVLAVLGCQNAASTTLPNDSEDAARSVVRSLELGLTVADVEASAASVRALALTHDGSRVESASIREESAELALRVPVRELDAVRRELRALGEVERDEERSEDVTTQRVDVGARARSARAEEERLLAMLRDDTASLSDVLAVEARLATVRERIELLEATEREIASRVELAHVHVRLSTRAVPPWARPLTTLGDAAELGVHAAAGLAVGLAAFVVAAAPVVALLLAALALVVLPWRALGRRRARARLAANVG